MSGFRFKQFEISQDRCAMKVGTDGVLLGAWATGGSRILDIGSGTGLVALMMAQRFPEARVRGVDIDEEACIQARENTKESPFADRVEIIHTRLQDFGLDATGVSREAREKELFDSIVSNPPFFVGSMKNPDVRRAVARHSDSLPFRELWQGVGRLLSEEGVFSVILPAELVEQFSAEGYVLGFYLVRKYGVRTVERKAPKRYLLAYSRQRCSGLEEAVVVMMESDGKRSEWYAKITDEFYL